MEKNWNAKEKLWKSYGIYFLGIYTNPDYKLNNKNNKDKATRIESYKGELYLFYSICAMWMT